MSWWPDGVSNPGLLPILLAAFLPLVLHILDRRRARIVDWPAIRFLVTGNRRRIRRWRTREALLLVVRTLVVLLIAAAVLRPFSRQLTEVRRLPPSHRGVVIVVDASSSMTYRDARESPSSFETAVAGARRILGTLEPGTPLGWIAARSPGVLSKAVLGDALEATTALRDLRPGGGGFRLLDALDAAGDLLTELPANEREIWILTDLQASSVEESSRSRWGYLAERLRASGSQPRIRIVDCGSSSPRNRFVSSVKLPPLAVATRETFVLEVTIEGSNPESEPCSLRLVVDGIEVTEQPVPDSSNGVRGVQLPTRLDRAGTRHVDLSLPPDGLPGDDVLAVPIRVFDELRVLLAGPGAEGKRGSIADGDADYVDLALVPRVAGEAQASGIFSVERAEDPSRLDLSRFQVVVVTGVIRADAEMAASLEGFVRRGGGLLLFAPSELDADSWEVNLYRGGRGLLPARPVAGGGGAPDGLRPRDVAVEHPALAVFSGGEEGDLSSVTLGRWTRWDTVDPGARTLAKVDVDTPWILEREFGTGKVIVVGTSSGPRDSDLPTGPMFLPLVHQLVRYLAARGLESSLFSVGEPISLEAPPDFSATDACLIGPDGSRTHVSPTWIEGSRRIAVESPTEPGFYELRDADAPEGDPASEVFACRIPPEESRLDRLAPQAVREIETGLGARIGRDPGELLEATTTIEERHEWWRGLVAAILGLALVELVIARGFAAGVRGRPKDTGSWPSDRSVRAGPA